MPKYRIPVIWSSWGILDIEAESIEEALEKAKDDGINLPEPGEYLDSSFMIEDDKESLALNNAGVLTKKDEKFLKVK